MEMATYSRRSADVVNDAGDCRVQAAPGRYNLRLDHDVL